MTCEDSASHPPVHSSVQIKYIVHFTHKRFRKGIIPITHYFLKKPRPLRFAVLCNYAIQPPCTTCAGCHGVNVTAGYLSQRWDSNPRVSVLQTDALNHLATLTKNKKPRTNCPGLTAISISFLYHNNVSRQIPTCLPQD